LTNRFVVGNPARDRYFYGRQADIEMILAQPWNWLCGQRRMGKTSVLFRLEAEALNRGWTPLFFSLAHVTPEQASGRTLFRKFLTSCRSVLQERKIDPKDFDDTDPADAFAELISRLTEPSPGWSSPRILFLWDEAERLIDVEANDTGFLERLRSLEAFERFGFVLAATQLLSGLFGREGHCSPFLTGFRWRPVGPLEADEARALLSAERTGGWKTPPPPDVLEAMIEWSGGHPYVLQEAGFQLEERFRRGLAPFDITEWQAAVLANQLIREIFRDDFIKLTITQQEVLSMLCRRPEQLSAEDLSRSIDRPVEQVEEACDFLNNYGYIRRRQAYELRFGFYRRMAVDSTSTAEPQKVSRIARRVVFISYAHADSEWFKRVLKFLKPAISAGEIEEWSDQKIKPGMVWRDEIDRTLDSARVALLLISQDFINSQFISEVELPALLARAKSGACRVLCLHISPSSMSAEVPPDLPNLRLLSKFQALNPPSKPLSELSPAAVDAELVRIAGEIAGRTK